MTKAFNIAVTLLAGAAHAEGKYYHGASKQAASGVSSRIDGICTGSI
jgi:hypothetical protein